MVMVLNGTIGARLHVGFPVLNRSSFGFWFSYFTVFSRVVLSMFWFAIQVKNSITIILGNSSTIRQSYNGSQCVYQVRFNHIR